MKNNIILQSRAERIAWVDGLRGIAILLVVLGHVNPPFKKIIYGFHMALFFIISGFLFKDCYDKKLSQWIKAYFQRYIVPYFMWSKLFDRSVNINMLSRRNVSVQ